jgi:adenine-specific DNA-methyltransferase
VPHITLKDIAGNREIDAIWERWQPTLGPLLQSLNGAVGAAFEEWEVPREPMPSWSAAAAELHRGWWEARLGRQRDVDVSIAAASETEYLVDRPYEDKKRVRVAGPFTVESASPNRMVGFDGSEATMGLPPEASSDAEQRFVEMALEQLRQSGVQQPQKTAKVTFDSVHPFAGRLICAEGSFVDEAGQARRAAILVGPEFGSVGAAEIASAATEAASGRFDMLVACAFHFDADSSSDDTRHALPVLKARMNADLHMAADLKNNGRGNLFVVFGEPDIELKRVGELVQVSVRGIDIFRPSTGTVETHQPDDIACWFVDTDYNGEHFIVRQAYFLGQEDPYESLRRTLKAEISEEAWATVYRSESRPFAAPSKGRIAVKVINHLGDEVTKVIAVT